MIAETLAARIIQVSYETLRQWTLKLCQSYAIQIRRRLPAAGDKWHLGEVVISIFGRKHPFRRAVGQRRDVHTLDVLRFSGERLCSYTASLSN
jgi:putative transposase